MSKPVDLVAEQMAEMEQRREDAWAALKKMHDQARNLEMSELIAAGGWCAPSEVVYETGGPIGTFEVRPLRDKIVMTRLRG